MPQVLPFASAVLSGLPISPAFPDSFRPHQQQLQQASKQQQQQQQQGSEQLMPPACQGLQVEESHLCEVGVVQRQKRKNSKKSGAKNKTEKLYANAGGRGALIQSKGSKKTGV